VVYDGNSHTGGEVPVDTNRYEEGALVSVMGNVDNLTRDGYSFIGWNTEADGSGSGYQQGGVDALTMGTADVVLYAQWSTNPTYTVSYDGNGNTGGSAPVETTNYEAGDMVTVLGNPNNLAQDGYCFTGWSIQADGGGTSYVQSNQFPMATDDVTLYAKWEAIPTYSVRYLGNGNDSGSVPIDGSSYERGVAVTVMGNSGNLARNGYTFSGWNTAADGSGDNYVQGDQFNMSAANERLVASFANAETITVSYDGNGNASGSVPAPPTVYNTGVWLTAAENRGDLQRSGYLFVGWYTVITQANGSYVTSYKYPGDPVMIRKEAPNATTLTLHARWVPRSSMLYNAGLHTGDFGGLAGANTLCEASVHPACGPRTKIRAFLDEGFGTDYTLADIPTLMDIDGSLPILSSRDRQISPNWAGLADGIDMSLAAAGVMPANTHWWSGGGVEIYDDAFFSSHNVCRADTGESWSTAAPSDLDAKDYNWGTGGSSSTTDCREWTNDITTVVYPLPGGGTHTINFRLECADSYFTQVRS
jgi:uncharacterized repeat protein (TIGR02543 family)